MEIVLSIPVNLPGIPASLRSKMSRFSIKLPALAVGVFLCGALALGQGGGGGRMRMQGGFGGRGGNEFGLLRRSDVQADLQLTGPQKTKLDEILSSIRGQRGEGRGRRQEGQGQAQKGERRQRQERSQMTDEERKAFRAQMEARQQEMRKKLAEVLNPTQFARLKEISIQLRGNMAILDPEIQKQVGLSASQVSKIKDLQEKMQTASRSVMEKAQSQEITREQAMDSMRKNMQVMQDELAKLLTSDQSAKLKALGGAPFKADPDEGGWGRRGGN